MLRDACKRGWDLRHRFARTYALGYIGIYDILGCLRFSFGFGYFSLERWGLLWIFVDICGCCIWPYLAGLIREKDESMASYGIASVGTRLVGVSEPTARPRRSRPPSRVSRRSSRNLQEADGRAASQREPYHIDLFVEHQFNICIQLP